MSAYQVHPDTIDLIVSFYESDEWTRDFDPQKTGEMLWQENARSVAHRYHEAPNPTPYRYRIVPLAQITPVAVLKSIDCLDYQSCETDDWTETPASRLLQRVRAVAIRRLPGYESAPWGWTRSTPTAPATPTPTRIDPDTTPF